jgi:acyl carrier protein
MANELTTAQILERTTAVFRDVFDDNSITITAETTAKDIEDWNSLMHINLVLAIEAEFGMKFSMGEVTGMKNTGEMFEILKARATK